jgi:hypothetical protein
LCAAVVTVVNAILAGGVARQLGDGNSALRAVVINGLKPAERLNALASDPIGSDSLGLA